MLVGGGGYGELDNDTGWTGFGGLGPGNDMSVEPFCVVGVAYGVGKDGSEL